MITVTPKVTSSELNGLTRKRVSTQCKAVPSAKNSGTMKTSESSGSTPRRLDSS